jgi:apolipoprotein N-acyltransferase
MTLILFCGYATGEGALNHARRDDLVSSSTIQYEGDDKMKKKDYMPVMWFLLGFGLFMFTRSTMYVPIALVLAPVFILRFARTRRKPGKANWLTLLGFVLSVNIALWGLRDTGDIAPSLLVNLVMNSLLALVLALPYIADRLLYHRFKGFLSTLVFPVAITAVYYLFSLEGPFDGDGVFYHYFVGDLALKQLASITGLWGLVFLVSWLASVIYWAWENATRWEQTKQGLAIFASIVAGIMVYGGLKISPLLNSGDVETVRIAAVTTSMASSSLEMLEASTTSPFEETIATVERLIHRAALGGAKIVAFHEYALLIEKTDEEKLFAELGRIADGNSVYLSLTYAVFIDGAKEENRQVFFNDDGEIEANYQKRYLLGMGPIGEAAYVSRGPGTIPVVETPYGTIAFAICKDMSFPPYARQAGRQKVDIMLDPSDDFPRSRGHVSLMRAIENGFSFVRPTRSGVSFAADYHGNVLASKDYFATSDEIMYADVPTKGKTTLYPYIGDAFAWICVLAFGASIVIAIRKQREEK